MAEKIWVTKDLLKVTSDYLTDKKIDSPRLTAEVLLAHQLNIDRVGLYLNLDQPLNASEVSGYRELIRRRVQHEPLQYITGVQEFWSMEFLVDSRVLIPRPETEILVEKVLEQIQIKKGSVRILELGTGPGILAVTLAKEILDAEIVAVDISSDALAVAKKNAEKHDVSGRIVFLEGDLWEPVKDMNVVYDIILSNPPYVTTEEYITLAPEVRDHEPREALDGREDGLYHIRRIIESCAEYLNPLGMLFVEMSPDQTGSAQALLENTGAFENTVRIRDYSGRYRVVSAQKKPH